MEISQTAVLKQRMNKTFRIASFLHCIGLITLLFLFGFESVGYKKMGLVLSILVFLASVFISRPYFYAEKQLKQYKTASPRSPVRKFNEHFLFFYFPYIFWCTCIGVFL